MSTPATETAGAAQADYRRAQSDERTRPGGGFLQRKYGPLPGWAWALIVAGAGVGYYLWRSHENKPTTGTGTTSTTGYTGSGTVGAAYGAELAAIQREISAMQPSSATTAKTSTTSTGTVKVPNVVGLTVDRAHSILGSAGLTFNTDTAKDKPGDERLVTGQVPKAGASVAKGTKVALTWKYQKTATAKGAKK